MRGLDLTEDINLNQIMIQQDVWFVLKCICTLLLKYSRNLVSWSSRDFQNNFHTSGLRLVYSAVVTDKIFTDVDWDVYKQHCIRM